MPKFTIDDVKKMIHEKLERTKPSPSEQNKALEKLTEIARRKRIR